MFGTGELVGEECSRKCKDFKITAVDKLTPGEQQYNDSSEAVPLLELVNRLSSRGWEMGKESRKIDNHSVPLLRLLRFKTRHSH